LKLTCPWRLKDLSSAEINLSPAKYLVTLLYTNEVSAKLTDLLHEIGGAVTCIAFDNNVLHEVRLELTCSMRKGYTIPQQNI